MTTKQTMQEFKTVRDLIYQKTNEQADEILDIKDRQIAELEEQNQMLTDCILEMSEIVYGGDE